MVAIDLQLDKPGNALEAFLRRGAGIKTALYGLERAGQAVAERLRTRGPKALMAVLAMTAVLLPAAMAKPNVAPTGPQPRIEQGDQNVGCPGIAPSLGRGATSATFNFPAVPATAPELLPVATKC